MYFYACNIGLWTVTCECVYFAIELPCAHTHFFCHHGDVYFYIFIEHQVDIIYHFGKELLVGALLFL